MAKGFLAAKEHSDNTIYTPAESFFLGGMLMCSDEHRSNDFVSLVRHNPGFANSRLLVEHRRLIEVLANKADGEVTGLENRRFEGFAVHFRSSRDNDATLLARAQAAIRNGSNNVLKAFLAGVFDGRASYDRRRGTQANTQFVVDCPQTNEDEIAALVVDVARRLGIGMNTNYSRERLEGGNPRKTQLRLRSGDARRFFTDVGLVSPEKLQRACELYGCSKTVERDAEELPGLKVIVGYGTVATRSAGRSTSSMMQTPRNLSASSNGSNVGMHLGGSRPTADRQPILAGARPTIDPKLALPKKKLTADELAKIAVGHHVIHKKFGEGVIVSKDDKYIHVRIGGKERMFAWPDAFEGGFLELV